MIAWSLQILQSGSWILSFACRMDKLIFFLEESQSKEVLLVRDEIIFSY